MSLSVPADPNDPAQQPDTNSPGRPESSPSPAPSKHSHSRFGFRRKLDALTNDLNRLGTAVATSWNPNHRHDEEHERERDAKIEAIRDQHPFRSFAPPRDGNLVKFHVDGHDYFWALSQLLEEAQETIFILDWWLSPELQLRRPGAVHGLQWRLDHVLQRKAEQGVKIYVIVYKEVTASMSMNSKHTKHALEDLHENIACLRHPDHSGGELVYYWSHHAKLCVVDNKIAAMGGLDACFGRWDTHDHPLADVHPTEWDRTLFAGQDYNNARYMDFATVDDFTSNAVPIQDVPRMPWHDVSLTFTGPSVVDLVQLFVERWNFIKSLKYRHDHRAEWLALPEPWDDVRAKSAEQERRRLEHPHLAEWAEKGRRLAHPFHGPPSTHPRAHEPVAQGHAKVQVLRSAADWSHGILCEDSIQQAYIQMIREAVHTIYIEK